jgi:hypothetical protein
MKQMKSTLNRDKTRIKANFSTRAVATFFCALATAGAAFAQGTAFIYQGRLADNGTPATGIYDLRFTIYDDPTVGNPVSLSLTNAAVPIANGVFTVTLDFGNVFNGSPRFLDIGVRTNSGAAFTPLSPRQALMPVPYAITAGDLAGAPVARLTTPNTAETATGVPVIASGAVIAANLASGGSGYKSPPAVTLNDSVGFGALVVATISKGVVVGLAVQNPGQNYSSKTTLTIAPPASNGFQTFAGTNVFTGLNTFTSPGNSFAGSFSGDGAGLGNLNASALSTGTVPDARLSGSVALLGADQAFTGSNRFTGPANLTNVNNTVAGRFTGDGSGLANLNASSVTGGTIGDSRLSTNVALLNADQTFSGSNRFTASLNVVSPLGAKRAYVNAAITGADLGLCDALSVQRVELHSDGDSYLTGGNLGVGLTTPGAKVHAREGGASGVAFPEGSGPAIWGDTSTGTGVSGSSSADAGYGVFGYATKGVGVYGHGGDGAGLYGTSDSGPGVYASSVSGAALTVGSGSIRVLGAGVGSQTAAFVHVATTNNTEGYITEIHNSLCDGDPYAMLIITRRSNPLGSGIEGAENRSYTVRYNGTHWVIWRDTADPILGTAFNVLIIKP